MNLEFNVNYIAVLAAAVAPMVIGFLWYGPLFGNVWRKLSGIKEVDMKKANAEMPRLYGTMFVASIVMAYVLDHFIMVGDVAMGTASDIMNGAMIGFWAWLGFVATTMLTTVLFDGKPLKLYAINAGYQLVSLVAMGAILSQMA